MGRHTLGAPTLALPMWPYPGEAEKWTQDWAPWGVPPLHSGPEMVTFLRLRKKGPAVANYPLDNHWTARLALGLISPPNRAHNGMRFRTVCCRYRQTETLPLKRYHCIER